MLTLDPASVCDVCTEGYGLDNSPHCIPCGHVFCAACLDRICEKNPRGPCCPLCRKTFTEKSVTAVHVEHSDSSRPSTPSLASRFWGGNSGYSSASEYSSDDRAAPGAGSAKDQHRILRIRQEARKLEIRVAEAAARKCTFDEVSQLHKEISDWLLRDIAYKPNSEYASLRLSAALLRAILLNSLAYSESTKASKGVESGLKEKLDASEATKRKLEVEILRQRQLYSEKAMECQQLQAEISRLKRSAPTTTSTLQPTSKPVTSSPLRSETPRAPSTPTPYSSASQYASSRSSQPSTPSRTSSTSSSATSVSSASKYATASPAKALPNAAHFNIGHLASSPHSRSASAQLVRDPLPPPNISHSTRPSTAQGQHPNHTASAHSRHASEHQRWLPTTEEDVEGLVPERTSPVQHRAPHPYPGWPTRLLSGAS